MIGDAITAALPVFRAQALSLMTDVCTVERIGSGWDEVQQKTVTTWVVVHANAPCHVETTPSSSRTLVTDEAVTPETPMVKAPHSLAGIEPDDRVTVAGREPMWVTHATHDDPTHPVELLIQCRRSK